MQTLDQRDIDFIEALSLQRILDKETFSLLHDRVYSLWVDDPYSAYRFIKILEKKLNSDEIRDFRKDPVLSTAYNNLILQILARTAEVLSLDEFNNLVRHSLIEALLYNDKLTDAIYKNLSTLMPETQDIQADKILETIEENRQLIGDKDIVVGKDKKSVKPLIGNWLVKFTDYAGGLQINSEKMREFIRTDNDAKKLSEQDRTLLLKVIRFYNSLKPQPILERGTGTIEGSPEKQAELQEILRKKTVEQGEKSRAEDQASDSVVDEAVGEALEPTPEESQGRPQPTGPEINPLAGQPTASIPEPPKSPSPTPIQASAQVSEQASVPAGSVKAASIPADLTKPKRGIFGRRKQKDGSGLQLLDNTAAEVAKKKSAPQMQQQVAPQPTLENSLQTVAEKSVKADPQGGAEYINQLNAAVLARLRQDANAKNTLADNWKQSPLYQKYLQVGQTSMQSGKPIQEVLQENGSQLTLEEFEKITALSKTLS